MELTITKTRTKKKPLEIALGDLDELVNSSMDNAYFKKGGDKKELVEELSEVPSDMEVEETMESGHKEPDGDEIPEELKEKLIEALMAE